jgi:hypothetical protein
MALVSVFLAMPKKSPITFNLAGFLLEVLEPDWMGN